MAPSNSNPVRTSSYPQIGSSPQFSHEGCCVSILPQHIHVHQFPANMTCGRSARRFIYPFPLLVLTCIKETKEVNGESVRSFISGPLNQHSWYASWNMKSKEEGPQTTFHNIHVYDLACTDDVWSWYKPETPLRQSLEFPEFGKVPLNKETIVFVLLCDKGWS